MASIKTRSGGSVGALSPNGKKQKSGSPPNVKAPNAATFIGYIDSISAGVVIGWVANERNSDPVTVELLVDGLEADRGLADEDRADLAEAGVGAGRHGFRLRVPPHFLDGRPHAVAARVTGTATLITPTPPEQVLGEAPPPPRAAVELPAPKLHQSVTLSVVIPTYNRGAVLENTVNRFRHQSKVQGAELVIIDDGSSDDTPERLKRLAKTMSNLVTERVSNGGPAQARNIAASMSRGEILVFVGDDTTPVDDDFLSYHEAAHQRMSNIGQGILGKICWPNATQLPVNYVMSHIQGVGEQQFGYHYMKGYQWYDWRLFYTSNVSIKKALVRDWSKDGFDTSFKLYGLEDQEFALRSTLRLQKGGDDFGIFYVPAAQVAHYHPYTVGRFLARQTSAGMMAHHFLELHPAHAADLGLADLIERLAVPAHESINFPIEHYFSVFEGLKSWALVVENHYGLGQQNWHEDLLRTVFQVAYFEGFLRAQDRSDVNLASGCRYVLETVRRKMHRAIAAEVLGEIPGIGLV